MNAKQYRESLYRLKSHPIDTGDFVDNRDSFGVVYGSLIPFLMSEYLLEANTSIPSGLVFPTGFLLFWAFYYTYYKPGFLEERLTSPAKWDAMSVPSVLLGVCIWFVKVTAVELSGLIVRSFFVPAKPRPRVKPRPMGNRQPPPIRRTVLHIVPDPPGLPADLVEALHVLELSETRDWQKIHSRYRELAKKYHPDLNAEITDVGRRFMRIDAAYRRLLAAKGKYFR